MLRVDGLCVRFGDRRVLDGVSLTLDAGESMAVVGSSGSGKSTLLRSILGAQRPDAGSITVAGQQVVGLREKPLRALRAAHLGMVFQEGELVGELDAVENVALPLLLRGVRPEPARHAAHELLDRLGVPTEGVPAERMSGGERQRTALGRALIGRPALVLADEPTGALDTDTRDEVADLVFEWCAKLNTALLVVTHDPVVAARAGRSVTLDGGVLHETSAPVR